MTNPSNDRRTSEGRRSLVLAEVLAGQGDVATLAETLKVSAATVRRDLVKLAEEGRIARTYGGAVALGHSVERRLAEKELANRREKEAIAAVSARLVDDGDVVIIDAGTTTGELALRLRDRQSLTVVTNGVNSLLALSDAAHVDVVAVGGKLRRINQAFVGTVAESTVRHIYARKVFLGVEGVLGGVGISCPTLEQSTLKELMASRGAEVYVLADHTKLETRPFPYFASIPGPWTLITDDGASPESTRQLEAMTGVSIIRAPVEPAPRDTS